MGNRLTSKIYIENTIPDPSLLATHIINNDITSFRTALTSKEVNAAMLNAEADPSGKTLFHLACFLDRQDMARLLFVDKRVILDKPAKDGSTAFFTVCEHGFAELVGMMLKSKKINFNVIVQQKTPLHIAYHKKHMNILCMLLESSTVDPNIGVGEQKETVFYTAVREDADEMITLFLKNKRINIDKPNKDGRTPFMLACQQGKLTLVRRLMETRKVNVNHSVNYETPLSIACQTSNYELVVLLTNNTKVNINCATDEDGRTPLYLACRDNQQDIALLLISKRKISLNQATKQGFTPLFIACQNGNVTLVRALLKTWTILENGVNGKIPLEIACEKNQIETVAVLITHSLVDINISLDDQNRTIFYNACRDNKEEIVRLLLTSKRLNVDALTKSGFTPFYSACERGHTEIVKILLTSKNKIDINRIVQEKYTAYSIACENGHAAIVQLLLLDARLDKKNIFSGFEIACKKKQDLVVNSLTQHSTFRTPKAVELCARYGFTEAVVDCLNDASVQLDVSSLLKHAVQYSDDSNVSMVALLLNHPKTPSKEVETILLHTPKSGKIVAHLLQDPRVNPNIQESSTAACGWWKRSPLHLYCESKGSYFPEGALALCAHPQTNVNQVDGRGFTPLFVACRAGNLEAVRVLLQRAELLINTKDFKEACEWHRIQECALEREPLTIHKPQTYAVLIDLLLADSRLNLLFTAEIARSIRAEPFPSQERLHIAISIDKAPAMRRVQSKPIFNPQPPKLNDLPKLPTGPGIIPFCDLAIGKKLGQGGFGFVCEAIWQGVTKVAVKQLLGQSLPDEIVREFKKEAENHARLKHPNIVALYGVCLEPMKYALVMELMDKGTLYDVLHGGSAENLSWQVRINIAIDVASGLLYLHSQQILHRDLKSLNVLLDSNMRAKLSDFGLARIKTSMATITTSATGAMGSIRWMAPELFDIDGQCSKATDIYSIAIIFWEIASRKMPYERAVDNQLVVQWVRQGQREKIPESTPTGFSALITRCWSQRAEDRPVIDNIVKDIKSLKI